MKKITLIISAIFMANIVYCQEVETLNIDLNSSTNKVSQTLATGKYKVIAKGTLELDGKCEDYSLAVISQQRYKEYGAIATNLIAEGGGDKKSKCQFSYEEEFTLLGNTEKEMTFTILKKEDNGNSDVKKTTYIYSTISDRKWITSFGVSGIKLFNADTYKTIQEGTEFKIVKGGSREQIDAIPVILFSVLNLEKEKAIIPSAGFGTDLEDITVFLGASRAFAQNLIVTAGIALHKQVRLGNDYNPGDMVSQNISFDDLHEDFFRVNPFISVTLHLDKNIFKKD